ncbi:hypothetical protein BWK59_05845 [Flavobacterium davisii]|uniref:DUF2586 family protein n=1 Tax=Flavobacterium davisii TaxID=2906077 RepID=A0A2D0AIK3_9FLAO|nr:DUF2586 family protein [Flavobacterium davisii]OWP84345.1 hypothetical protein BWK59_05845 [Flavobacterium davisii]
MAQGNGTPKVNVAVTSGNLQRQIVVLDGIAGIVATAEKAVNIGVIKTVFGYDDAIKKGYTETDEPFLHRQIKDFYQELGGNQELWVMGVEDTMTLNNMVNATNTNGIKKLLTVAQGRITLLGVCRKPASSYTMVAGKFLDKDVEDAILTSKTICQYQQSINRPFRLLIEGRTNDITKTPFNCKDANNSYVGVVLGNSYGDNSANVSTALARAVKYPAHVKLGNGQNGALSLTDSYIGNKPLEQFYNEELDALTDAGYIITHRREGSAGYYYSVDTMAGADDYRILVHGRLMDKAQRIATATTSALIETSVRMEKDGSINKADATYLEDLVKAQIRSKMEEQISNVDVLVPTNQNLINTSTLSMQIKIQPLGYMTWIAITMGLTKSI